MRPIKMRRKVIIVILSVILITLLLFFTGRYIFLEQIRKALYTRLDDLRKQNIFISFKSAVVNPWSGDINISELSIGIGDSL
ncbi:MAG TPA: hypothetical protein VD816_03060, partial [Ohtaekwangia sp.]|nr:hypothetical protein [Ohtaekwangia sp.]